LAKRKNKTGMEASLSVRKAGINDIPVIRQIAFTTWPVAYGQILSKEQLDYMLDKMYSEPALQEQIGNGHQFYLAGFTENILGFASVSKEEDGCFKLNKLYVLPDTQKSGAGRALLQEVISYTKANNGSKLILQVNRNNQAKGFYEKHGFRVIEEIDLAIGNGYFMNDYIMELAL
jgi:ribosomal protein S18 acetylase RimI-like enzyme